MATLMTFKWFLHFSQRTRRVSEEIWKCKFHAIVGVAHVNTKSDLVFFNWILK